MSRYEFARCKINSKWQDMNKYATKYEMKQLFYSFFSKHHCIIGLFTKRTAKINISLLENGTFLRILKWVQFNLFGDYVIISTFSDSNTLFC